MSAATKVLNNVNLNTHILKFLEEGRPGRVNRSFHDAHQQMMLATLRQIGRGSVDNEGGQHLTERLRKIAQRQHLDPQNRLQAAACLRALHQDQRLQAQLFGRMAFENLEGRWRANPHLGLARFENTEQTFLLPIVLDITDECLSRFWISTRTQYPGLGGMGAPGHVAPAPAIRAWMNAPANRDTLAGVPVLAFNWGGHSMLPPEIGKLTALRHLEILGDRDLMALPEEMRELRQLQRLDVTGSFEEFPPVIREIPALENVCIYSENIHVLPDDIWRRFAKRATIANVQGVFEPGLFRVQPRDRRLTDSQNLTDVPFSLWFIETVEIPYVDLFRLTLIPRLLQMLMQPFSPGGIGFEILPEGISTVMRFLIAAPVWAINVLLNGMILVTNLFLFYIVEPLVTLARDLLGYSRMVHARLGGAE